MSPSDSAGRSACFPERASGGPGAEPPSGGPIPPEPGDDREVTKWAIDELKRNASALGAGWIIALGHRVIERARYACPTDMELWARALVRIAPYRARYFAGVLLRLTFSKRKGPCCPFHERYPDADDDCRALEDDA